MRHVVVETGTGTGPGVNPFAAMLLRDGEARRRFLDVGEWSPGAIAAIAAGPPPGRARAADVVAARNTDGDGQTLQAVEQVRRGTPWYVVAGQQAGLLTGPLYTVLKAVTALRLVQALRDAGTDAVALFWVASEDHDLAEVRTARLLSGAGEPFTVTAGPGAGASRFPTGPLALGPGAATVEAALETGLAGLPFAGEVRTWVLGTVRAEATFAGSFTALMRRLFAGTGLLLFDPLDPAVDGLRREFAARAAGRHDVLLDAVREDTAAIRALGFKPRVGFKPERAFWFHLDETLGRRRLTRTGTGGFRADGSGREWDSLERAAADEGARFSPDVLMRPVFQNWLFPVAAVVGGPGEMAYHAQLPGLFREMAVGRGLFWPRGSASVLPAGTLRKLERLGLSAGDLFEGRVSLLQKGMRVRGETGALERYRETRQAFLRVTGELEAICAAFTDDMSRSASTTLNRVRDLEARLEARLGRETRARGETVARQVDALLSEVFPGGKPQERVLCAPALVARHGPGLVRDLLEAADPFERRHAVLVGEKAEGG
ncbi:MAG: bacillithiol biosynthesis cysteine-adding enzyme BshC [Acidobacteria bacterium]|nr:bacillithiol biosynthesis cysteine-adding enzyme BshC [Acidobacteriota bacterium]